MQHMCSTGLPHILIMLLLQRILFVHIIWYVAHIFISVLVPLIAVSLILWSRGLCVYAFFGTSSW